jgi:hypothetical protein
VGAGSRPAWSGLDDGPAVHATPGGPKAASSAAFGCSDSESNASAQRSCDHSEHTSARGAGQGPFETQWTLLVAAAAAAKRLRRAARVDATARLP